ncbi:hypothetical protein [Nitratireductor basaltis]|uniref:Flagella related protein n=1 Tax=Nitratireductor basaltis TaxID=472175 RepID=A0A084U8B2_9HYPH|nr:hypothetical protein [Nitratireductor basaltis]KFB09198.1 hypothetical protein EL18_00213 [Nitratireductor basaltis]
MNQKLAGLVLPDETPVEDDPAPQATEAAPVARSWLRDRIARKGTSDLAFAFGGLGLALTCALFPWYIFFNQEKFGIRPLQFEGRNDLTAIKGEAPDLTGMRLPLSMDAPGLDFLATGNVPDEPVVPAKLSRQPFPGDAITFRLVHAAHGRAMIEDDAGFWIVQRGSKLPDGSKVSSIERRGDEWVLVTSSNKEIPLTP